MWYRKLSNNTSQNEGSGTRRNVTNQYCKTTNAKPYSAKEIRERREKILLL
jgi:hypothetical protein